MTEGFAFMLAAAQAVDNITGGRLLDILVAFIAAVLFIVFVGIVLKMIANRT